MCYYQFNYALQLLFNIMPNLNQFIPRYNVRAMDRIHTQILKTVDLFESKTQIFTTSHLVSSIEEIFWI